MFEKELADKLKRIFDLKKVRYDAPSDSQEQECLFVEIEKANSRVSEQRFVGQATGKITVWGNSEKLPYGYFTKRIVEANKADTKDLFFYDFEENSQTIGNISQRGMAFRYLFDLQYNPNVGEMTELETIATIGNEQ